MGNRPQAFNMPGFSTYVALLKLHKSQTQTRLCLPPAGLESTNWGKGIEWNILEFETQWFSSYSENRKASKARPEYFPCIPVSRVLVCGVMKLLRKHSILWESDKKTFDDSPPNNPSAHTPHIIQWESKSSHIEAYSRFYGPWFFAIELLKNRSKTEF